MMTLGRQWQQTDPTRAVRMAGKTVSPICCTAKTVGWLSGGAVRDRTATGWIGCRRSAWEGTAQVCCRAAVEGHSPGGRSGPSVAAQALAQGRRRKPLRGDPIGVRTYHCGLRSSYAAAVPGSVHVGHREPADRPIRRCRKRVSVNCSGQAQSRRGGAGRAGMPKVGYHRSRDVS